MNRTRDEAWKKKKEKEEEKKEEKEEKEEKKARVDLQCGKR
jgi:hypothetical protein